jgi:hypothetical protein
MKQSEATKLFIKHNAYEARHYWIPGMEGGTFSTTTWSIGN